MLSKQISLLKRNLSNVQGWSTGRKIVVIESDDWGSIRMSSKEAFESLKTKGINVTSGDSLRYNKYDSLASAEDLTRLFELLSTIKDCKGNSCCFTAVSIMANPDFDKIRESDFTQYFYEPFTDTLKKYPGCENSFALWKQGIDSGVFIPQFHGREHLNVASWMTALKSGHEATRIAFDHGVWGFNCSSYNDIKVYFQAAFDVWDPEEIKCQGAVIKEGLELFERLFGYKASFFVPPNGPFNNSLEKVAADMGIKYMSTSKIQQEAIGFGETRKVYHKLGQRNEHGQTYITRNCFFEPSDETQDWISKCLSDISIAFRWNKPAVISTHRVNYVGRLYPENRERNLKQIETLLREVLKKWPEVEFMTSPQLGELMQHNVLS